MRADEFTKQTFLTFSGPVQLPGVTLAAGTYMFKLADPESGRRAIQVWDKDGTKLYTTLLTIPDQRMKVDRHPGGDVQANGRAERRRRSVRGSIPTSRTASSSSIPKQQATEACEAESRPVVGLQRRRPRIRGVQIREVRTCRRERH